MHGIKALAAMLLIVSACHGYRALDAASQAAKDMRGAAVAASDTLAYLCQEPSEACEQAWQLYDVLVAEMDALIDALAAADAAIALGEEPDERKVMELMLRVGKALRSFQAAVDAL